MRSSLEGVQKDNLPSISSAGSGASSHPICLRESFSAITGELSSTTANMSMIGLATKPGTDVLPMCSSG